MTDVAKEYGAAFFALACEKNAKKEYSDSLKKIGTAFSEAPDYMTFLTSPSIPLRERLCAIDEAFAVKICESALSFLKLLCEKGRLSRFDRISEEFFALLSASEHISSAVITSAVELTDSEKRKLISKLETTYKTKVNAEYRIDSSIIGGIVVEIDGNVLDGSLRHRLREVKDVMNT